jgi:hypothetical protein
MNRVHSDRRLVSLMEGALLSGLPYRSLLDLIAKGEARGCRDDRGHWWIPRAEARRLAAARRRVAGTTRDAPAEDGTP